MAYDPHEEDYQRLAVRYQRSLDRSDPFGTARALAGFERRFENDRDSLPQSDQDRAFHLVARATELIDYQLPFTPPPASESITREARRLLEEALALDPECHDATRMLAAAREHSFEGYYRFLVDGEERVRIACERARDAVEDRTSDTGKLAADIAMRPYLRWLASEASRALICGRYRASIAAGKRALALDGQDPAGVALTMALAYAKLEDNAGLLELQAKMPASTGFEYSAWNSIALLTVAYKLHQPSYAEQVVQLLLRTFPHAGATLMRQDELPDGVFGRMVTDPS